MSIETGWKTHSWTTAHGREVPGDPGRVIRQCRVCKRAFLVDDMAPGKAEAVYLGPLHVELMPAEVTAKWTMEVCPPEVDPKARMSPG